MVDIYTYMHYYTCNPAVVVALFPTPAVLAVTITRTFVFVNKQLTGNVAALTIFITHYVALGNLKCMNQFMRFIADMKYCLLVHSPYPLCDLDFDTRVCRQPVLWNEQLLFENLFEGLKFTK